MSRILFKKDLLDRSAKYRDKTRDRRAELEEVFDCLIAWMKEDFEKSDAHAYHLTCIGEMYMPLFTGKKEMIRLKSPNSIKRYERIQENIMSIKYSPTHNKFVCPDKMEKFCAITKIEYEELERLQNLEDIK